MTQNNKKTRLVSLESVPHTINISGSFYSSQGFVLKLLSMLQTTSLFKVNTQACVYRHKKIQRSDDTRDLNYIIMQILDDDVALDCLSASLEGCG